MKLFERFLSGLTYLMGLTSFSPVEKNQHPLPGPLKGPGVSGTISVISEPPVFKPPGGKPDGKGSDFLCEYPSMSDYASCWTEEDKGCWLRKKDGTDEYSIYTDYESRMPTGVVRDYTLYLSNQNLTFVDGLIKYNASIFNETYPGPWLQACWGDTLNVTIVNDLRYNGSTIHWHGIRQNQTTHMDGVNGITQCPIPPGSSFTYTWNATQYGTSWYHSHYSLAYADGLAGPLTIHGPSSANYDEAVYPLLMTDWGHITAFDWYEQGEADRPWDVTFLLNGKGDYTRRYMLGQKRENTTDIPGPHTVTFKKGKRYLLRLINTSVKSHFVFSIDNHIMKVIASDFVSIRPYWTDNVLVGIGQRYHVIVEAIPKSGHENPIPDDGLFWIRTNLCWEQAHGDKNQELYSPNYDLAGVLKYEEEDDGYTYPSTNVANLPTSLAWPGMSSYNCTDEPYEDLVPIVPWTVGLPSNGDVSSPFNTGEFFTVNILFAADGSFKGFSIGPNDTQLWINFSTPTVLDFDSPGPWDPRWVIIPENFSENDWVYLHIISNQSEAHPIHLHGHDFALVYQDEYPWNFADPAQNYSNVKWTNPPRRDVALLPPYGNMILAFRADNPGAWITHCHIADHASYGLAMQILERQGAANALWPVGSLQWNKSAELCAAWDRWYGDSSNWWPGEDKNASDPNFQDDSGI